LTTAVLVSCIYSTRTAVKCCCQNVPMFDHDAKNPIICCVVSSLWSPCFRFLAVHPILEPVSAAGPVYLTRLQNDGSVSGV